MSAFIYCVRPYCVVDRTRPILSRSVCREVTRAVRCASCPLPMSKYSFRPVQYCKYGRIARCVWKNVQVKWPPRADFSCYTFTGGACVLLNVCSCLAAAAAAAAVRIGRFTCLLAGSREQRWDHKRYADFADEAGHVAAGMNIWGLCCRVWSAPSFAHAQSKRFSVFASQGFQH